MEDKFLSLANLARGSVLEKFDFEMKRIIENIQDINTPALAKRKLTINIIFAPSESRTESELVVSSKLILAPTNNVSTRIYMDGEIVGELVRANTMPGQEHINAEGEQQSSSIYKVK